MAFRIVAISGRIAAGKSTLATGLAAEFGCARVSTRELLHEILPRTRKARADLQVAGELLDQRTNGNWVAQAVTKRRIELPDDTTVIVDSVRIRGQIYGLRRAFGSHVLHL